MTNMQLKPLNGYEKIDGPVVTIVMDGLGLGKQDESDGVYISYTPVLDKLMKKDMLCSLKAHGRAVGLPSDGDMGNSEVGHNALGAGRIFAQGAQLVNDAIESEAIFAGKAWAQVVKQARADGTVHFIGLLSDGNVHSNIKQLYALLDKCAESGIKKVRIHSLLDGRDVGPKSALNYITPLEEKLNTLSDKGLDYRIGSGGGRMITTMDRYGADWSVVERGWKAHVLGVGRQFGSATEAINTYYAEDSDMTDQYMESFVICEDGAPVGTIEDGDAVVFINFRGDRAIEISRAFDEESFTEFDRVRHPNVFYAGLMQYDGDAQIPNNYLVEPPAIDRTLGEYLCASDVTSYAISETQKFGHVTYFWNGNKSGYINETLEKYEEIESDRIAFDLKPWMKAAEITDKVIEAIQSGKYKSIRLNYPNCDMVGHTGIVAAIRIATETVDLCLARVLKALKKAKGIAVITADHGNADCMWKEKGGVVTPMVAHTLNPVPFVIKDYTEKNSFVYSGVKSPGLANVAATVCVLLGFEPPKDYEPTLVKIEK